MMLIILSNFGEEVNREGLNGEWAKRGRTPRHHARPQFYPYMGEIANNGNGDFENILSIHISVFDTFQI